MIRASIAGKEQEKSEAKMNSQIGRRDIFRETVDMIEIGWR